MSTADLTLSDDATKSRDIVWFVLADPVDADEWQRTAGVSLLDLTVYVPASYGDCEHSTMLLCCEDGFLPALWGGRWHVPCRWMARQRPELRPTLEAIERIAQEQMRDD